MFTEKASKQVLGEYVRAALIPIATSMRLPEKWTCSQDHWHQMIELQPPRNTAPSWWEHKIFNAPALRHSIILPWFWSFRNCLTGGWLTSVEDIHDCTSQHWSHRAMEYVLLLIRKTQCYMIHWGSISHDASMFFLIGFIVSLEMKNATALGTIFFPPTEASFVI